MFAHGAKGAAPSETASPFCVAQALLILIFPRFGLSARRKKAPMPGAFALWNQAVFISSNYAHVANPKKSNIAHFPTSKERDDELAIIRWCIAVPNIRADSPRFAYYVSRWDVPGKIDRARCTGTLDDILANCPPIDPAWVRFVPAALAEWRAFQQAHARPKTEQAQSSPKLRCVVQSNVLSMQ